MQKKSGTAGSPVSPTAPKVAENADVADPGEVSEIKAAQRQTESGKYGAARITPFRPASGESTQSAAAEEEAQEDTSSWIEIELIGEDDRPIPGEKYRVTLPDGSVAEGTLDQHGWARVQGFAKGDCKIAFPDLDQDAWEFTESLGERPNST